MSEWQSIETAPIDKDILLGWQDGTVRIGQRYARSLPNGFKVPLDFGDFCATAYTPADYVPTLWMPVPNLPVSP